MKRPLKVLQLRDSPWVDGPGRTILETACRIDPANVEFHIGALVSRNSTSHPLLESARARGAHAHAIVDGGGLTNELLSRIEDLVRSLRVDVLHTSEFRSNVLGALVARRCGVRLVTTVHGWIANDLRGRLYRMADKALLRYFDAVICVSQATRSLVPAWWLPSRKVHVLYNGLMLDSYARQWVDQTRTPVNPDGRVTLLNVGRLSREKGQGLLLQAVSQLVPHYPGLRLQFAGIGPLEGELRAVATSLGIVDRIEFLGYIGDMPPVYAQADLLVQSSLTEGLPNVILEAAYLRLPIVATAVGGTAEIVENGRSGILIRPGSVDELRQGIDRFLRDPGAAASMTEAAHATIRSRFSFDARTEKLVRLYEDLQ